MKLTNFSILLFLFFAGCSSSKNSSQDKNEFLSEESKYQKTIKSWKYFDLNDTLKGKLIDYIPSFGCGTRGPSSAVGIIQVGDNLIRVIDQCNSNLCSEGDSVLVTPAINKSDDNKFYPVFFIDGKAPNSFYEYPNVMKTTKGEIEKIKTKANTK